jgi:RNA polymerase sigma-70 factor (ECF subfamily)
VLVRLRARRSIARTESNPEARCPVLGVCNIRLVESILLNQPIMMPEPHHPEPDSALVAAVRRGDERAIGVVYERYGSQLLRLLTRLLGSRADAEDALHDLFVGLPEALSRYQHRDHFGGWLRRVAARLALMRLRAERRHPQVSLDALATSHPPPVDVAEGTDIERALATLDSKLRVVFVLYHVEGFSHAEIASLVGITSGASRVRLSRAVASLRSKLTP